MSLLLKDEQLEILHSRNKLMEKVATFSIIMSVLFNALVSESWSFIFSVVILSGIMLGILHVLNKSKKCPEVVPLYISISTVIFTFCIIKEEPHILTFMIVFFNVVLMSLYQSQKPLIINGVMQSILTVIVYLLFGKTIFPGWGALDVLSIIMYIVIITGFLMYQSSFYKKLQEKAALAQKKEKLQQETLQGILDTIKGNIVDEFSYKLNENIKDTSLISKEMVQTFHNVATENHEQIENIEDIDNSIKITMQSVNQASEIVKNIKKLMEKSLLSIKEGEIQSTRIHIEINSLEQVIIEVIKTMEQLIQKNKQIEGVIESVNDVAQRTKFLAFNTTIEAQRVNGNNQAFTVIADEIMALADHSEKSAGAISDILNDIKQNTESVGLKVELGKEFVEGSREKTNMLLGLFKNITANADSVMSEVEENNLIMQNVEKNAKVAKEKSVSVREISIVTQNHIQAVLQSSEEQMEKVLEIEHSYKQLEESLVNLYLKANKKESE